jgi:precorrin-3B synthase
MNAPSRRGFCPALFAPMQTGDGLLVRLAPAGTIALENLAGLCAAARAHGNGIIEVTARGSIQVRGLSPASTPAFADAVTALGFDGADAVSAIAGPLASLAPDEAADASLLAADLRRALAAAPFLDRLGPKVSVVIDGGGALHLDALAADVRLRAETAPDGPRLHVALGGDAVSAASIGSVAPEHAVEATVQLLAVIATRGRQARAHDIVRAEGVAALRAAIAELLTDAPALPTRPPADPIGSHRLRDGRVAVGLGLAFGHTDAPALGRLIDTVKDAGASGLRTAPGHALLIIGIESAAVSAVTTDAARLGFIVHPDDPRRYLATCAGKPFCGSAHVETRARAPDMAAAAAPLLDGSLTVHLSGCAKGCAHPRRAMLTIVGDDAQYGIVVNGSACDAPLGSISIGAMPSSFARLAQQVERARRPDERAADTLSRLGATRVVAILQGADRG